MSIYYRRESYRERLFLKNLHLKKTAEQVIELLPEKFSFRDFISTFRQCFSYKWDDIVAFCNDRKRNKYRRISKGLRTVTSYTPESFIRKHVSLKRKTPVFTVEERESKKKALTRVSEERQRQLQAKLAANMVYVQEVCPVYVTDLIHSYFKTRREQSLDVNARYLVLLEATQFKCRETIDFLHKISACEKNYDLRMMAFYSLQRIGEHPWLARKRKGRKHLSELMPIDIKKNPTELLRLLYRHQHLIYQQYDVFLSHSSLDVETLLNLKVMLNEQGMTVYIDWVNDREMLNRPNQNEDIWPALELRMEQSKKLLFVMTDNSLRSPYTKREVEYFKTQKKPVYIYQPGRISLTPPDYLSGCYKCDLQSDSLKFSE